MWLISHEGPPSSTASNLHLHLHPPQHTHTHKPPTTANLADLSFHIERYSASKTPYYPTSFLTMMAFTKRTRANVVAALDVESRKPPSRRDPLKTNDILDSWSETPHPTWFDYGSPNTLSWANTCWQAKGVKVCPIIAIPDFAHDWH